jgi:Xaa-Pro aminopeptidase
MAQRLKRFLESLQEVDAALVENPVDLLYLTGLSLSRGRLLVGKDLCLFVDGRYLATAQQSLSFSVRSIEEKPLLPQRIAFDSSTTTCDALRLLERDFPYVEWVAAPQMFKRLRAVKEPEEISALRKARALTLAGIEHVKQLYKEGVSEKELAWQFELFCRTQGASGLSFDPILAFGEKSAYPHYRAGGQKLERDQSILCDVGAIVDGYRGDLTRTFFFGKPDATLLRFQEVVAKAFDAALKSVRPGIAAGEIDQAARGVFKEAGVEHLFIHSLGHGIGLETHEFPSLRLKSEDRIEAGMVFTIEPGLYQPGVGGIRFEEMILVTEKGAQLLHA